MDLDTFCIWARTRTNHEAAIKPGVRWWLGLSRIDRWVLITIVGSPWFFMSGTSVVILTYLLFKSFWLAFLLSWAIATVPWWLWLVDMKREQYWIQQDLSRYLGDGAVLATRAEYVGGHPALPHGRYVYLTINGYRENPFLTIIFPSAADGDLNYQMPLLDIESADEKSEKNESLTDALLASLTEKTPRLFGEDRVTLNVKYNDAAGRCQTIELANFFNGAGEVRNWRNYLICAQAEADTGVKPLDPWKSLRPTPEFEENPPSGSPFESGATANGYSRNGSRPGSSGSTRTSGSAFRRR